MNSHTCLCYLGSLVSNLICDWNMLYMRIQNLLHNWRFGLIVYRIPPNILKKHFSVNIEARMEDTLYNAGNVKVFGRCERGYTAVKEAFVQNFVSGQEANASLCVYVNQKCVIDLFGTAIGDIGYTRKSLQVVTSHLPLNSITISSCI